MDTIPITQEGYDKIVKEYDKLKKKDLPESIKKVAEARSHGDLKENAEYHAAREYQSYLQGRIAFLQDKIARSQILKTDPSQSDRIIFGSRVKTFDIENEEEEEFTLVGAAEADPGNGKISTVSPIGKNLLGKRKNDIVTIKTPGGNLQLKIIDFS
jgi:transcription elongation factor GreA